jgi:hypothetical protein
MRKLAGSKAQIGCYQKRQLGCSKAPFGTGGTVQCSRCQFAALYFFLRVYKLQFAALTLVNLRFFYSQFTGWQDPNMHLYFLNLRFIKVFLFIYCMPFSFFFFTS